MKHLLIIEEKTNQDYCRNDIIRDELQQRSLLRKMKHKQLEEYGYLIRMKQDRLPSKIALAKRTKKRKRFRPRKIRL